MFKIAWNRHYAYNLPSGHRFPMEKYNLIPEQLLYEGTVQIDNFFSPQEISEEQILTIHQPLYWQKLKTGQLSRQEIRKIGFPYSDDLITRERMIAQGTKDGVDYALKNKVAMNVAGGTHHAFTDRGEGFCLLNDIALAAHYALSKKGINQILIIDLDVHQGNGTAEIFKANPAVFTFSVHGQNNYPLQKEASDLDIGLPDKIGDDAYLKLLKDNLYPLIDQVQPDFIFYLSGVDVLSTDKLGRLGLSIQGCKTRDRIVLEHCKSNNIPLVVSMGGGYSERINIIVEAHSNTFRLAQEIFF